MNSFVLLFLTLFSLQQSTVRAPSGGAIGAPGLHITKEDLACEAILNLLEAADLRLCWNEFVEDAITSSFEKETSQCKVFFEPNEEFIKKLAEGKKVPLNGLNHYAVYDRGRFKVVIVAGAEVTADFYCSKRRSSECEQLMPKQILGTAGSLLSCFSKWQGLEIARIDPMIMLTDSGWPRSVLIDPEFTLQGMPLMVRSKPWVPASIEYEKGRFKIETEAGDKFSTVRISGIYIPHLYLDAVARIYRIMEMYGDLYYVPRVAPRHLHIKGCAPLSRLFLEADITPHEESKKPFEELTYLFVPSDSFFLWSELRIEIEDIFDVEKCSKDGFLVLTLIFRKPAFWWKPVVKAAFYCAEAKKRECEEIFTSILEIQDSIGLYRCRDEWEGLILESKKGRIEFTGVGLQPFVGPLPQPSLLFDPVWAMSRLESRKENQEPSAAIPEDYVKAVDHAYKKHVRSGFAKLVVGMKSRLKRGIGSKKQTSTQGILQP